MAWYDRIIGRTPKDLEEKLNPSQPYYDNKIEPTREPTYSYERAYEELEIVNRGVNMIVDDSAEIRTIVGSALRSNSVVKGIKRSKVDLLLNTEPNPFQDINTFRRNCIIDLLLDGNIFIYFDGVHLYHLPADKMIIHASDTTYIEKFTFNEKITYSPSEIIHVKENSFYSIYRGVPRLSPALRTMKLMKSMRTFQDNFFKNGAVPGLVLKSPNTLSEKIKERMLQSWQARYRPEAGGRRPLPGGRSGRRVPDLPQGGWPGAQPHRGGLCLHPRSLVEPRQRGAGDRPGAPDRSDATCLRVPAHRSEHGGGQDRGAAEAQARSRGCDHRGGRGSREVAHRRGPRVHPLPLRARVARSSGVLPLGGSGFSRAGRGVPVAP